ncbi:MAG: FUSC family membrane protein [Puia sp.]
MDYQNTFRSFINSHYLSEGIRITVGLTLPAIIGTWLHQEAMGITMSLGASCVIMVDNAGPVHHRRNAMFICTLVIFIVALLTGFIAVSAWATGILIAFFCFLFPMIGVYGARAGSIGLAALFIMVLNLEERVRGWQVLFNALYVACGAIWYTLLSLSLYGFRPFKVSQQALGDCIQATAGYLLARSAFYNKNPDFDQIYSNLIDKQAEIHEKQNLVRELLFKSRDIVKETTNTGRVLLLIFLDIIDLFERLMSTQPDYKLLHQYYEESDILEKFRELLLVIAEELNETGISVKSGRAYPLNDRMDIMVRELKNDFEQLRDEKRNASNVEGFIALRNVLEGLEEIVSRLHIIQQYSSYDLKENKRELGEVDYDRFVTHQDIDWKVLIDNVNWKSNTFRHAARVSIATTAGFIVSQFFPLGHSYWILLTIIVILKPNYGLTKKRNYDRVLGTITGAAIAATILYFIRDRQVIFGFMIVLMVLAYSFMRLKYLVFVTLMTPYILILFYLLNPHDFKNVVGDRLLDTAIGSAIAFLANIFIAPAWVKEQFTSYLMQMIQANKNYFRDVATSFIGEEVSVIQYKYSRKMAYVALANVTDALNRMLAEPKRKQKNAAEFHQFVVLNYMLASHTATLASYARRGDPIPRDKDYQSVIDAVLGILSKACNLFRQDSVQVEMEPPANEGSSGAEHDRDDVTVSGESSGQGPVPIPKEAAAKEGLRKMNDRVTAMILKRKAELDQGILESPTRRQLTLVKSVNDQFNFITKISEDLFKVAGKWK